MDIPCKECGDPLDVTDSALRLIKAWNDDDLPVIHICADCYGDIYNPLSSNDFIHIIHKTKVNDKG